MQTKNRTNAEQALEQPNEKAKKCSQTVIRSNTLRNWRSTLNVTFPSAKFRCTFTKKPFFNHGHEDIHSFTCTCVPAYIGGTANMKSRWACPVIPDERLQYQNLKPNLTLTRMSSISFIKWYSTTQKHKIFSLIGFQIPPFDKSSTCPQTNNHDKIHSI